jgi:hypothetical protein
MIKPVVIEAGQRVVTAVSGVFFAVREASAAFKLKIGNKTWTLEGGDQVQVDGGFNRVTLINLSTTEDLTVDFVAGAQRFNLDYVKLPRTRIVGQTVNLAQDATQDFLGLDEFGKRRKQFTITVGPDIQGSILVFDKDEGTLLAIVSANETAGVGFAIETDANLQIKNCTNENPITSAGATFANQPTIAVAETFYR